MLRLLTVCAALLFSFAVFAQDAQPKLRTSALIIETKTGAHRFTVETALSPSERERGMMFRDSMGGDEGMLFTSGRDEEINIWMKNTLLSLDIVFIDADGRVTLVHENAVPQSLNVISSRLPVRAVLELKAGTARKIALRADDRVKNRIFD